MATWADVLAGGLTSLLDGARDVLVAKEQRLEQYPPGGVIYDQFGRRVYGPMSGGYAMPGGYPEVGIDPLSGYPNTGIFGLTSQQTMLLALGALVVVVVVASGD
ncbi:MAG: hypothetical protein AMXMBFR26_06940 [Porticoccaceae bacterium]